MAQAAQLVLCGGPRLVGWWWWEPRGGDRCLRRSDSLQSQQKPTQHYKAAVPQKMNKHKRLCHLTDVSILTTAQRTGSHGDTVTNAGKKQKKTARSTADGTQLYRSSCAEVRLLRSLAPHYGLFTSLLAILHCNQRPVTNRVKQPNKVQVKRPPHKTKPVNNGSQQS